tara:strand:+ start:994 stop:1920 length:927 start_codon:yes stop_codon:yes gene_type:complete
MDNNIDELAAILSLLEIKGLGPVKFKVIYNRFKSFRKVFDLSLKELKVEFGFRDIILKNIIKKKDSVKSFREEAEKQKVTARLLGANIITYFDDFYPPNLFESNHCVPILYTLGNTELLKEIKTCAVVGTRKPSSWTTEQVNIAVKNLVNEGYTIVSGLALGVDAIAHGAALDNNSKTISVLGCGVDVIYPKGNAELREKIIHNGIIVSEYKFGMKVQEFALKKRNKITVGLSKYVLVAQTSDKGGTMNAYRAVKEQKKRMGVLLPKNTKGFEGNLKILEDKKIEVLKFKEGKDVKFPKLENDQRLLI